MLYIAYVEEINYVMLCYVIYTKLSKELKIALIIKGALDNFSLIPNFFFKKVEIFVSLEVYTYEVTAC